MLQKKHTYRILIIWDSVSGKTISWFKLISLQPDFDKTYSYPKDLHEAKYQFLISKHENTGLTLYRMGLFGAVHK